MSDLHDDTFGLCPHCHRTDGCVTAGKANVFYCKVYRVSWCVGTIFKDDKTEEEQRRIWDEVGLEGFETVVPFFYPRPPDPRSETSADRRPAPAVRIQPDDELPF
jgi:hypothetical protein